MKYSNFSLDDMIWAHYSHRVGLPPRAGLAVRARDLTSLRLGWAGDRGKTVHSLDLMWYKPIRMYSQGFY